MLPASKRVLHFVMTLYLAACGNATTRSTPTLAPEPVPASSTSPASSTITPAPDGIWDNLLLSTPFPHLMPLPEPSLSPLDGTFAKVDPSPPQWWTCYRCADYRPMGGIWRVQFDNGVMRIYYEVTSWKSIASFTVEETRLKIFNDPFCPQEVGEYEWIIENGLLRLTTIEDGCAFDLRSENLTKLPWAICSADQPAEGCADPPASPPGNPPAPVDVTVNVIGGDSHYFKEKPELFAAANPENVAPPEGITIHFDEQSIDFGTHRVLWSGGDWIEASTSDPYTHIGVQFWGSGYLGWARVLFDGQEVWRGLTTSLGKKHAYYGGYIEVTGFEPGEHTIRVESLSFDHHPVKVAAFGFSNQPAGK